MSRFQSSAVASLSPYVPGEQSAGKNILKLNTNESPYGPSNEVLEAIRSAATDDLRRYPVPFASELRHEIASDYGLKKENVFAGNGSDEVLAHAFHAFFAEKAPVLFPEITYSFYHSCCRLYGIEQRLIPLSEGFEINPDLFHGPCGGVVIANPNAPTGLVLPLADIERILQANEDVLVLVDEAYIDFGGQTCASLVSTYKNLLVVQTFSKSRGLAGLRVGMAIGDAALIDALYRVKDSFNSYPLDSIALAGAKAAWQDKTWLEATCAKVISDRDRLAHALDQLGFRTLPSSTNFVFASHAAYAGADLFEALRERSILVRHFETEPIQNWLRISVGTSEECDTFLNVLRSILD